MIESLLKKLAWHLDREKIPYMIIGGQAVLLYGVPRLTRDIDITLGIDTEAFSSIKKICKSVGLKLLPKEAESFTRRTKVLPTEAPRLKFRVDFIFSSTPYERQAIRRAKKVKMKGYFVKFASLEDLLLHKLFAARAIDEEDVTNILLKHRRRIDLKYMKKWLSEFAKLPGQERIQKRFSRLRKEAA